MQIPPKGTQNVTDLIKTLESLVTEEEIAKQAELLKSEGDTGEPQNSGVSVERFVQSIEAVAQDYKRVYR